MKNLTAILLYIFLLIIPLYSQVDLSGSAKIGLINNIPEANTYTSLLNPDNFLEVKDINISTSLISKLTAGDDKTTLSIWFSLKKYPIGQALIAASYGDSIQQGTVLEIIKYSGDSLLYFDLMRFSINAYLNDYLSLEVGRQSMLTGYGWGWNPIDFANPIKNPIDPDGELRGVDAISLNIQTSNILSSKLYCILPIEPLSSGLKYSELKTGAELILSLTGIEVNVSAFYNYKNKEDLYTPAVGIGFLIDLIGIGLYSEAVVRDGSRNIFINKNLIQSKKEGLIYNLLIGAEYTFITDTYLILEYFYNGEGYNKDERENYKNLLTIMGPTTDLLSLYSPGYFSKNYIMFTLLQPLYNINSDINISTLYSIDTNVIVLMPSINYSITGNYNIDILYIGMFDPDKDKFSEVSESPVRHNITISFTYSF